MTNFAPARETLETPAVNSFNEWDPLEEVIVGVLDGACIPEWHVALRATMPEKWWGFFQEHGGKPFPRELVEAGNRDLDEFAGILESEGVVVRRPEVRDCARPYQTPDWASRGGLYAAMPRDTFIVFGDEIVEAPMAWRSRYFEISAFRPLLKEYFARGARWTAAPKPELLDDFYDPDFEEAGDADGRLRLVVNEAEPTFDAADITRCGRDVFVQRSHVTNDFGIAWLRRHLEPRFRVHELAFNDTHPMHIDATFVPLAPGKVLVNPERVLDLPPMFKGWDVFTAPQPCIPESHLLLMTSRWLSMNVLMLDEERVMVERGEESIIRCFKDWGFKPIPCTFRAFNTFGGSFHCATVDVRRRGALQSYF